MAITLKPTTDPEGKIKTTALLNNEMKLRKLVIKDEKNNIVNLPKVGAPDKALAALKKVNEKFNCEEVCLAALQNIESVDSHKFFCIGKDDKRLFCGQVIHRIPKGSYARLGGGECLCFGKPPLNKDNTFKYEKDRQLAIKVGDKVGSDYMVLVAANGCIFVDTGATISLNMPVFVVETTGEYYKLEIGQRIINMDSGSHILIYTLEAPLLFPRVDFKPKPSIKPSITSKPVEASKSSDSKKAVTPTKSGSKKQESKDESDKKEVKSVPPKVEPKKEEPKKEEPKKEEPKKEESPVKEPKTPDDSISVESLKSDSLHKKESLKEEAIKPTTKDVTKDVNKDVAKDEVTKDEPIKDEVKTEPNIRTSSDETQQWHFQVGTPHTDQQKEHGVSSKTMQKTEDSTEKGGELIRPGVKPPKSKLSKRGKTSRRSKRRRRRSMSRSWSPTRSRSRRRCISCRKRRCRAHRRRKCWSCRLWTAKSRRRRRNRSRRRRRSYLG